MRPVVDRGKALPAGVAGVSVRIRAGARAPGAGQLSGGGAVQVDPGFTQLTLRVLPTLETEI